MMNKNGLPEWIQEMLARVEQATPGPYDAPLVNLEWVDYFDENYEIFPPLGESGPVGLTPTKELARLFAHSVTDIPRLCAALADANEALEAAESLAEQRRIERNAALEAGLALEAMLTKAKSALEFYADEGNWSSCATEYFDLPEFPDANGWVSEGQREVELGIDIVWSQADPGYGYAQEVLNEIAAQGKH